MAVPTMHTEDVAIFNDPPYNTAEDSISWVEYKPTFISEGDYSSIHFHIDGNATQYIDLSRTELYVRFKIDKHNGEAFADDDSESCLPIDMILHTMWSSVDISLNQKLVSSTGTNYNYKAAIECLLNYSKNTKTYQLTSIGMTNDDKNFDSTKPREASSLGGINSGLISRKKLFGEKGHDSGEFIGPLFADICNQGRLILDGVDIDIKLWPATDPFRIISNIDIPAKINIQDIHLRVCKVEVNKYCMSGHYAALQISNGKYPIQKVTILTKSISQGSFTESYDDLFQGLVPSRLIIGFVSSEAFAGNYKKNPLKFNHYDIESVGFYVNNKPTPRPAYRFNISNNQFLDALNSLYRITNKYGEDSDNGITREMWKEGLSLIAFDVDPTSAVDFSYLGIPKAGHTRLNFRFKAGLPHNATIIIYAVFPARVEIDNMRNVTLLETKDLIDEIRNNKK